MIMLITGRKEGWREAGQGREGHEREDEEGGWIRIQKNHKIMMMMTMTMMIMIPYGTLVIEE